MRLSVYTILITACASIAHSAPADAAANELIKRQCTACRIVARLTGDVASLTVLGRLVSVARRATATASVIATTARGVRVVGVV
ncbi:hypothetical protein BJX65DRAFT_315147 [Aspergillus insuetus]